MPRSPDVSPRDLPRMWIGRAAMLCGALAVATTPAFAASQDAPPPTADLKKLTVEQLMDVVVTSVSRMEERFGSTPAALAVLTSEDIRRTGATSVPEALRLVPGVHVARQTSNQWAISARGFSSLNSEKLLVLSDTRSIYTPLFSGVLWDVQDYLLHDVDRIEVIRGPGAALWGSNAVNGVINITTKHARDTQGLYAETSVGSEERTSTSVRYGGRLGAQTHYRLFGRYFDRGATFAPSTARSDGWDFGHAGGRLDHEWSGGDTLTVQGDLYRGTIGQLAPAIVVQGRPEPEGALQVSVGGGNVLGRWRHRTSGAADLQLRVYYDRTHRDDPTYADDLDTLDVDAQHRFARGTRQEVTWGVGYRATDNRTRGKGVFALDPPSSRDQLVSGFVQDQITLRETLRLTLGTKLEHNDFSGFEAQPSARVAWERSQRRSVWGAVSRAVRVPTRLERDIAIDLPSPPGGPTLRLSGSDAFEAETLVAYEVGHRWRLLPDLLVDVAAFFNRYGGLASLEIGDLVAESSTGRTVLPVVNRNLTDGDAKGVEALVTFAPRPFWHLTGSYTNLIVDLEAGGLDLNRSVLAEDATPRHQLGLRSSLDVTAAVQVDAFFRSSSAIRRFRESDADAGVPSYAELDLRLAWRGWRQLEISVTGQNLLRDRHVEFGGLGARGEIERSVYARVAWGF